MAIRAVAILVLGFVMTSLTIPGAQSIGVCNGDVGNNLPPQEEVVALYKQNNIGRMRLYKPKADTLQALRGSGIELMLGVPTENLQEIANDVSAAARWIETNVRKYSPDVRIKYIVASNEVSPNRASQFAPFVFPAMQNLQRAITSAGLQGNIKVSVAFDMGIMGTSYPPSAGVFHNDVQSFMNPIISFLVSTRAPLLMNIYPYFAYIGTPTLKLSDALFTNKSPQFTDDNNQLVYYNLFDAMLDSVYAALEKAGGSSLEIVVSESGWPSAGGGSATTVENAGTYYRNLIQHVKKGSPKKLGKPIETYLFAMFDENSKLGDATERHFGLFTPSKQSKFSINFS